MAARRALEWIGMFKGPAGFLDMTCFNSELLLKYMAQLKVGCFESTKSHSFSHELDECHA